MKTTFEQLRERVSPTLEAYRNDLFVTDKELLDEWDGPFIYGWRKTGTDLLKCYRSIEEVKWRKQFDEETQKRILEQDVSWVVYEANRDRNHWFLYFDGQELHEKTAEEVEEIYLNYISNLFE